MLRLRHMETYGTYSFNDLRRGRKRFVIMPLLLLGLAGCKAQLVNGGPSVLVTSPLTASSPTPGKSSTSSSSPSASPSVPAIVGTKLVFTSTLQSIAMAYTVLNPSVQLTVEDGSGNIAVTSTATVTIALTTPAGATLAGTLSQPVVNGVATFNDLNVDLLGSYTLTATAPSLTTAVSSSFSVQGVVQQAYVKTSDSAYQEWQYGGSVALSQDGNTMAVGAFMNNSGQTTITNGPGPYSNSISGLRSGAAYILTRSGGAWSEQAYLKPPNASVGQQYYGSSISLSSDGNTVAIGAPFDRSGQTTITNGSTAGMDTANTNPGAIFIVTRSGATWTERAYLKAPSNPNLTAFYGVSVALSGDGNTVAIGAPYDASNQTVITNGGTGATNGLAGISGAVFIVVNNSGTWSEQAYIKAPVVRSFCGDSVGISNDGNTAIMGCPNDRSSQTTITNGTSENTADISDLGGGAAYILTRTGTTWAQTAYLKAPNALDNRSYGTGVALSGDGKTAAIYAADDYGNQSFITNGPTASTDNSGPDTGAVYIVNYSGGLWSEQAYIKLSNNGTENHGAETGPTGYPTFLSLSQNGNTLVFGKPGDTSVQTGVTNSPTASSNTTGAVNAGAAFVLTRTGSNWSERAYLKSPVAKASINAGYDYFGSAIAVSGDGSTIAIGTPGDGSTSTSIIYGASAATDDSGQSVGSVFVFTNPWNAANGI